jgi:hypothetical protein
VNVRSENGDGVVTNSTFSHGFLKMTVMGHDWVYGTVPQGSM